MTTERVKSITKQYTNEDTGEVVNLTHEEAIRIKGRAQDHRFEMGYAMTWPENMWQVRLSSRNWQVFWLLAAGINIETGVCHYSVKDMAGKLELVESNISRSVARLIKSGLARRVGRGRVQLDPRLLWRGPLKLRREALYANEARIAGALLPGDEQLAS